MARMVRLTLLGENVRTFRAGETFDVPPAIGQVLVSDGWAIEVVAERRDLWHGLDMANDDPSDSSTDS